MWRSFNFFYLFFCLVDIFKSFLLFDLRVLHPKRRIIPCSICFSVQTHDMTKTHIDSTVGRIWTPYCRFFFSLKKNHDLEFSHHDVLLPPEGATLSKSGLATGGLAEDGRATGANDNGLGVREDGCDGEATRALDIHEERARSRHKGLKRTGFSGQSYNLSRSMIKLQILPSACACGPQTEAKG